MKTKILHKLKKLWFLLPMLALFLATSMVSQAQTAGTPECNAAVVTDKDDYAPFEVALISGSGWLPGETVEIQLFSTNLDAYEYFIVLADSVGNFAGLEYDILEIHLGEQFVLEALGLTSKCKAVWYFTDGNVTFTTIGLPVNTGVSVSFKFRNPTGANNDANSTIGSQITTFTIAARNNELVKFSYPTAITINDVLYNRTNVAVSGGETLNPGTEGYQFEFESPNAARTVTATYVECPKPVIVTQPSSQGITYGNAATFSVVATGATGIQWQVNTGSGFTNVTDGGVYSGATTSTLTLTNPAVSMSTYQYRSVVSNACGSVTSVAAVLTINARPITITADAKSKVYGATDPALTYQITAGSLAGSDAFTGALTRTAGENVGTYAITQGTLALNNNYNLTFVGAILTISQLAVTVTADAKSKTYGQVDPALTFVSSPAVGTTLANGLTVGFTGSLTRSTGEDVGSYGILQGSVANSNYIITYQGANLVIGELAVTVTADAKTKTYGDLDPALTFVSSPAVGFALANGLTVGFTGSLTRSTGEDVGSYGILQGSVANSNYIITYTGANLVIGELAVTVTAEAKSKTYGQVDPALTFASVPAVGSALANGLTVGFTGSLTRNAGENVGSYAILQGSVANSNYNITYTGANLTLRPLAVTVTADAKRKHCGQINPSLTFVSNPAVGAVLTNGETIGFTGALSRVAGEGVGFYNILIGSLANSNYAVNYVGAQLQIMGIAIDASASSAPVPVGSSATISAVVSPAVAGVSVNLRVTNESNTVIFNTTLLTDASGRVTATVPSSSLVLGVYMVVATAGSGCATSIAYIPVFDASGSFVTGGGWINSPAGALTSDATIVGKANFGFVARYRRGSNQVDGNTEFQFNAGSINFKSTFHESGSLVISGRRATYRGTGTVNGVSGFRFTLVAIDGHLNNGTGPDRFRIKITNGSGGVVYDNGLNAAENTDVSTALGGGSIVIHEVKIKSAEIEIQTGNVAQTSVKAYPNPFSERVFFDLQFAKDANAMLEIFDLRGAKLGTLLNQRVEAGQQYRLEYTPMDVVPGMLMYRLVVDGEVMNGRILYQKQK